MTVGSADVHKAVATLWESSGLNTLFQSYWDEDDREFYTSLNENEAAPGTPMPYVTFEALKSSVAMRMSGPGNKKFHVNDQPLSFIIYAAQTTTKTAKTLASELAEEILKVFGGHPSEEPDSLTLDNGSVLIVQYQTDYPNRQDDEVYNWTVEYNLKTDIPIMV